MPNGKLFKISFQNENTSIYQLFVTVMLKLDALSHHTSVVNYLLVMSHFLEKQSNLVLATCGWQLSRGVWQQLLILINKFKQIKWKQKASRKQKFGDEKFTSFARIFYNKKFIVM